MSNRQHDRDTFRGFLAIAAEAKLPLACEWVLLCTNEATLRVPHPVITAGVPTCQRCADRHGLEGAPLVPTA